MKEETKAFAEQLFKDTAEKLGTDEFYIAGGALRDFVEHESKNPSDIDCFFTNQSSYEKAFYNLLRLGFDVEKERNNSRQMSKDGSPVYDLVYLELAVNGTDVINGFDFTNCCIAFGKEGLITSPTFFEDVKERVLRINKIKLPYHSISRAGKFETRGYKIPDSLKIELFDNAASTPLNTSDSDEYGEDDSDTADVFRPTPEDIPF